MTDSLNSDFDQPDEIEPADLLEILKSPIPEEVALHQAHQVQGQLIELLGLPFYQEILNRGFFTREDLDALLQQDENVQKALVSVIKENRQLRHINQLKEEKIVSSIELILSLRSWNSSLLDEQTETTQRLEDVIKNTNAVAAYQLTTEQAQNKELIEEISILKETVKDAHNHIEELEEQVKKSSGAAKNFQTHKLALTDKIEALEAGNSRYQLYLGLVGTAAAIFFVLLAVTWLRTSPVKGDVVEKTTGVVAASEAPILRQGEGLASDGFVDEASTVSSNNFEIQEPDEIMDSSLVNDIIEEPTKVVSAVVKKDNSQAVSTASKAKEKKTVTKTYVVQKNDTLYSISKKFYNSGNYAEKIKKDNQLSKGFLKQGQKIKIVLNED